MATTPTLLCIHGFMTGTNYWSRIEGVNIRTYALKGHNHNTTLPEYWSIEVNSLADWILEQPEPRYIIAHSMGGYLLQDALLKHELHKKVEHVIYINSTFIKDDVERQLHRQRVLEHIKKRWTTFYNLNMVDKHNLPDLYQLQKEFLHSCEPRAMYEWQRLMMKRLKSKFDMEIFRYNSTWIIGKHDPVYHHSTMCSFLHATEIPYTLLYTEHHSLYEDYPSVHQIIQNILF